MPSAFHVADVRRGHSTQNKTAPKGAVAFFQSLESDCEVLALSRLEAGVCFVDNVNTALAAHDPAVLVALLRRLQGISNLHNLHPQIVVRPKTGM